MISKSYHRHRQTRSKQTSLIIASYMSLNIINDEGSYYVTFCTIMYSPLSVSASLCLSYASHMYAIYCILSSYYTSSHLSCINLSYIPCFKLSVSPSPIYSLLYTYLSAYVSYKHLACMVLSVLVIYATHPLCSSVPLYAYSSLCSPSQLPLPHYLSYISHIISAITTLMLYFM